MLLMVRTGVKLDVLITVIRGEHVPQAARPLLYPNEPGTQICEIVCLPVGVIKSVGDVLDAVLGNSRS